MRIPADCTMSLKTGVHAGLLRPKFFVEVSVHSKELDLTVVRVVLGRSLLLRLRLLMAKNEALRIVRKLKKFKTNQGI